MRRGRLGPWAGIRERHHHHDISLLRRLLEELFQTGEHRLVISGHQRAHFPGPDIQPMRLKQVQGLLNGRRQMRLAKRIETDLRGDTDHGFPPVSHRPAAPPAQ